MNFDDIFNNFDDQENIDDFTNSLDDKFSGFEDFEGGTVVCNNQSAVYSDNCDLSGYFCRDFRLNETCIYHIESPCPEGYYCKTSSTISECEKGHYCIWGSAEPTYCSWGNAVCPNEKMTKQQSKNSLLLFIVVILAILMILKIFSTKRIKYYEEKRKMETTSMKESHSTKSELERDQGISLKASK